MDRLWTPWRYNYVTRAEKALRKGVPVELDAWEGELGCVFCNMIAAVEHAGGARDGAVRPPKRRRISSIAGDIALCA